MLQQPDISIQAVVTRPDKPKGRLLQLAPPPVKEALLELKIPVPIHQPIKASTEGFCAILQDYAADLFVVVAYGEILKGILVSIPKLGPINIHPSNLPKYRGAAPIRRALMHGDKETGVTIIEMVLEMDAGPMLDQIKIPIADSMNHGELEEKLMDLAATAILRVIRQFADGNVKKIPQDPSQVIFAPKLRPEEEEIHWNKSAEDLHNQIRALAPSPGAWSWVHIGKEKRKIKIKKGVVSHQTGEPGEILLQDKRFIVACSNKSLELLEVQLEGKKNIEFPKFFEWHAHANQIFIATAS